MTHRGQTLLELVIASGVLLTTVTAALTLILRTTIVGQNSSSKSEALNYAREGLEVVRMVRDSNWLKIDRNVPELDGAGNPYENPPGTIIYTTWDENSIRIDGAHGSTTELIGENKLPDGTGTYVLDFSPTGSWPNGGWGLRHIGAAPANPLKLIRRMSDEGQYSTQNVLSANCTSLNNCVSTKYCRELTVTSETDDTVPYLKVVSKVYWPPGNNCQNASAQSVSLTTRLYDWR